MELETLLLFLIKRLQGKFTINKSGKPSSSVGIDQAHKQNNKLVKMDDGSSDLQNDNTALLKWTVAGHGNTTSSRRH